MLLCLIRNCLVCIGRPFCLFSTTSLPRSSSISNTLETSLGVLEQVDCSVASNRPSCLFATSSSNLDPLETSSRCPGTALLSDLRRIEHRVSSPHRVLRLWNVYRLSRAGLLLSFFRQSTTGTLSHDKYTASVFESPHTRHIFPAFSNNLIAVLRVSVHRPS